MVLRKCIACGEIRESTEMIKVTRVHNTGEIVINPDSRLFGRSAYLCYNKNCRLNAIKKRRFQKTLKKEIPFSIIEEITKLTENRTV